MIDFDLFKNLIETGEPICLKVNGNSMRPFLRHNIDSVIAVKFDGEVKVGDVVFFTRSNGTVVMHRVVKTEDEVVFVCGDAQETIEGPVQKNQIFAKVTSFVRNGKEIHANNTLYRFLLNLWIKLIPWRHLILEKIYR